MITKKGWGQSTGTARSAREGTTIGGKGKSQEHMGSTKENEGENKISHKGQHLPTKDQTCKIYIRREH